MQKYLELGSFTSNYIPTTFFLVITRDRSPVETLALADRVLQIGSVFFDYGIHDGKGHFSTDNQKSVPTQEQLEVLSLGILARPVFFDQMIKTNPDYILMVPVFSQKYLNCGGHEKAVLVIRAQEDGTPLLDVCSEIPANVPFPTDLGDSEWIKIQDEEAKKCGGCRLQCEHPLKWNRDLASRGSQRPLTVITTIKQIGKAIRVEVFRHKKPVRYTPYRREQLRNADFIKKLLVTRANMVKDRFTTSYWQQLAEDSGLSKEKLEEVVAHYIQEANDPLFLEKYQRLEEKVAVLTPGPYSDENHWYNIAAHNISKLWGGGFLLEKPLVLTPREKIITYAPVRVVKKAGTIFCRDPIK